MWICVLHVSWLWWQFREDLLSHRGSWLQLEVSFAVAEIKDANPSILTITDLLWLRRKSSETWFVICTSLDCDGNFLLMCDRWFFLDLLKFVKCPYRCLITALYGSPSKIIRCVPSATPHTGRNTASAVDDPSGCHTKQGWRNSKKKSAVMAGQQTAPNALGYLWVVLIQQKWREIYATTPIKLQEERS